jgi:hypothetical protein
MSIHRRFLLLGSAAVAAERLVSSCRSGIAAAAEPSESFTPEMFGARGDGVTNDTDAFAALSDSVNANGGGTITFRRTTYLVGKQVPLLSAGRNYAFEPRKLLQLVGCRKPLTIVGNNARIKCVPGLRFGTFDPESGRATTHPMPWYKVEERATPYEYMILVANCSGPVRIADLELDGSLAQLIIGGEYGDTGRQIAGSGIYLLDNRRDEIIQNVYSHHHPQDGLMINGIEDPGLRTQVTRRIENLRAEYNGRQGCSIVGGFGYAFVGCKFAHTGKAGMVSAPGAGVDIEAEGAKTNRNLSFANCEFVDNYGCGFLAESGDSERIALTNCTLIGSTNWAAWPNKPHIRFNGCKFVGSIVNCFGDPDPTRATQFQSCTFSDDPAQSPTRAVFREGRPDGSLANLSDKQNIRFRACTFNATHGAVLPWSTRAIYDSCTMRQISASQPHPRGTYLGITRITCPNVPVDLYSARLVGQVILNGRQVRPGELGSVAG